MNGVDVEVLELLEERGTRGRPSDRGDDLVVEFVGVFVVDEWDLDRRRAAVVGYSLGVEELPDPAWLDLSQTNVRPRDGRDTPSVAPATAVEHREDPQEDRIGVHLQRERDAQGVEVGTAVAVHHALWLSRGTRSVVNGDGLFLVLQHAGQRLGRSFGQVVLVGVAALPGIVDPYDIYLRGVQRLYELLQLRVHEEHLRARVLEDVTDLVSPQTRVQGHQNTPGIGHGEVRLQELRDVRSEKGHPVVLLESRAA
jgi:hypothetical protein